MKKKFYFSLIFLICSYLPLFSNSLFIVTSIPDIEVLGKKITGDRARYYSLTTGVEDLHAVPIRPSFLHKVYQANLLVSLGLDAEHAWLPMLAKEARNPKVMPGGIHWAILSIGVDPIDKPQEISRIHGEQHPQGNPHYNVSPDYGPLMLSNFLDILIKRDCKNKSFYQKNYQQSLKEMKEFIRELQKTATSILKGKKIISYHSDLDYLIRFYQMELVGHLEKKSGVPPTIFHLKNLSEKAKTSGVDLVVCTPYQEISLSRKFAKNNNAHFVIIHNLVGSSKRGQSWEEFHLSNYKALSTPFVK